MRDRTICIRVGPDQQRRHGGVADGSVGRDPEAVLVNVYRGL